MKDLKYSKYFSSQVENSNEDEYTLKFRITSDAIDYTNEIVNPDGVKFSQHPKILYGHDHSIPSPAKAITTFRDGNSWISKIQFDVLKDPFARFLYEKYKDGYMTDCSIGFKSNPDAIEINKDGVLIHNDILVHEISLVNIGANSTAHKLSIEECEMVIKSVSDEKVKQIFEVEKYKQLNDMQTEVIEKLNSDIEKINIELETIKNVQDEITKELASIKEKSVEVEIKQEEIVNTVNTSDETTKKFAEVLKTLAQELKNLKEIL